MNGSIETLEEVWLTVEEFPEYLVSNLGAIRHKDRPEADRKIAPNHRGFPTLALFKPPHKNRYVRQLNKLVANAFLAPPRYSDQTSVWHIDGDLLNCRADNLKWERRDRVLEWNEMNRGGAPRYTTPKVLHRESGMVFANALECGLYFGETESTVVAHIERYNAMYVDRAKYSYVD